MSNNRECAAYFKSKPEYHRCLAELRKKWISYGRAAGVITLKNCTEEEKRVISSMLGKHFFEEEVRFSFAEFERGLQKTKYAPVDIRAVLEIYFGKPLSSRQEQKENRENQREAFLKSLRSWTEEQAGRDHAAYRWVASLCESKAYGYHLLIREYHKDRFQAGQLMQNVCRALLVLTEMEQVGDERQLAVFSADVTGNPHYFDRGSTAGQLFVHAVCFCMKLEEPHTSHQWREVLMEAGIVADTISSQVHAYGLHLKTEEGWHPAYEAFCRLKEPCVVTLDNLSHVIGVRAAGSRVYIVENEMVFSYLTALAREQDVTILCTSGQPRAAAIKLLRMMADSGITIYYSGDIDPDGMLIADRLQTSCARMLKIWRMAPEDYEKSISTEPVGSLGLAKLDRLHSLELKKTAELVKKKKFAGYQENLRQILWSDIVSG